MVGIYAFGKILHDLYQVLPQHFLNVPLVEHLDDTQQFDLLFVWLIGEVDGRNAKFIKQATFNDTSVINHDADATDIPFDISIVALYFTLLPTLSGKCRSCCA